MPEDRELEFVMQGDAHALKEVLRRSFDFESRFAVYLMPFGFPGGASVGRIRDNEIRLERVRLWWETPFKPCFFGRIEQCGENTVLSGQFRVSRTAIGLIAACCCFMLLVGGLMVADVLAGGPNVLSLVLIGLSIGATTGGFIGFGVLGYWLRRSDREWITRWIAQTSGADIVTGGRTLAVRSSGKEPPALN